MRDDLGGCIAVLVDRRTGEEFNICRFSTTLGRETGNDLNLEIDKTVSRQHAVIHYLDGKYLIQDLSSKNGTAVNGAKITKSMELRSGDEISLGLTQLIFVLIPQVRKAALPGGEKPGLNTETIIGLAAESGGLAAAS